MKDTVKKVEQGVVVETVERSQLKAVQTPQGFSVPLLKLIEARNRVAILVQMMQVL